jgi:glucose/arabinose dehydrogenase
MEGEMSDDTRDTMQDVGEGPDTDHIGRPARLPSGRALDLPSWLAYLYAPILPYLKQIHITRERSREHNPADILLPVGYVAEVVATGFNAPVHCCFDEQGFCYVSESGHKIDSKPRILKVDVQTGQYEPFYELPEERWIKTGALTGACWHAGYLYFTNTDALSRIGPDGAVEDIVTGLPGRGDHQTNYPVAGPDGKIYFGQGSATNSGVVGADNFAYEWLAQFPTMHDVPAQDITLVGRNYPYKNVLGDITQTVRTGAYVQFGTETHPGQVIKGDVKCTGAILRCNPDSSELEVVAWGLRNPYGIAFTSDGRLFATEHGMDDRSKRHIVGDPDDFYEITPGAWYGWPDFASGIRLDDPRWGERGQGREPVIAEHPDPHPPKPFVSFLQHAAANGVDFCPDPAFGFAGDAFVACFGDLVPITTARLTTPAGFKVVRIDMRARQIVDFAVNTIAGPASKLPHAGFERPSHCQFGPDGALYVVDWGEISIAPEAGGLRMPKGTGTLWRIRRTGAPRGDRPPEPKVVPLYALQLAGLVGAIGLTGWVVRRLLRRR